MEKGVLFKKTKKILAVCSMGIGTVLFGQTVIYQQNFDGNNGTFTNTIVSQNTALNGWLANSTAAQYGNVYRHVWNFSDVNTGNDPAVKPISGRSLGMGFYNGNEPFVPGYHFATYAGEPSDPPFYTTRWAHVGFSTVGYENITVEFKWRCTGELFDGKLYDYGTVNTSIDGGATWAMDQTGGQGGTTSEHGTFTKGLYYGNSEVQTATLTLPASRANQANFRLAFRMVVDEGYGTGGGFIIDDIIVRGTAIQMATKENAADQVQVYTENQNFMVKSQASPIEKVELYDTAGKILFTAQPAAKTAQLQSGTLTHGVYVLKIRLQNGQELSRKIRK